MAQSQVSDDGKYVRSGHALTWTWIAFTVAALAAALAIGIFRIGAYQSAIDAVRSAVNGSARRSPVAALQEEAPMLIREGARISVPDGSPLRGKLTVGPVAQREIQRKLVLPAVVEADPARTVKVLPPVTGRVTDLKVQLGERVVQGQDLAVIDSGDLAQAYSDIDKARSVLTLTKKALDPHWCRRGKASPSFFTQIRASFWPARSSSSATSPLPIPAARRSGSPSRIRT